MNRIFATLILTTFLLSQEGEITNVIAAQRTDGSGIVDISYELLPDDTFPSFEVSAYIISEEPELYWVENEDASGWSVFANTGLYNWYFIQIQYLCYIQNISFNSELSELGFGCSLGGWVGDGSQISISGFGQDPYIYLPQNTSDYHLFTIESFDNNSPWENCQPYIINILQGPASPDLEPVPVTWLSSEDLIEHLTPIFPSGAGLGENILPGEYSLTWQLPDDYFDPSLKIRIMAEAYIFNSDLPFTMVSVPSGDYYDLDGIQQTMEYSYEIMKTELTNNHIVEWALLYGELDDDDELYLANIFSHINFDGGVLVIEPGYTHFPALFSTYSDSVMHEASPLLWFFDYYGLRVPTQDEWIYAARGHNELYFPWSNTSASSCWIEDVDMPGQWYCIDDCFENAFCIDGEWPFSVEGIYDAGSYPNNASPFGALDMLGNVQEIYTQDNGSYNYYDCLGGLSNSYLLDGYNNNDNCNILWEPWTGPYCGDASNIYECIDMYSNQSEENLGLRLVRTIIE